MIDTLRNWWTRRAEAARVAAASAWIDDDRARRVNEMLHSGFYAHHEAGVLGWMRRRAGGRKERRG